MMKKTKKSRLPDQAVESAVVGQTIGYGVSAVNEHRVISYFCPGVRWHRKIGD
jgi:hypothetical protein